MIGSIALLGAAMVLFADGDSRPLVTISVPAQHGAATNTIDISLNGTDAPRTREQWRDRTWTAVRTSNGATQEISSATCPALKAVAESFRDLPPITPTPLANVVADEPLPLNTIGLGGWGAVISFKTFSGADVQISGSDAYGSWASRAVNELLVCWNNTGPS